MICKNKINENDILEHLFNIKAINSKTHVIDQTIFSQEKKKLQKLLFSEFNITSDLFLNETGLVKFNPEIFRDVSDSFGNKIPKRTKYAYTGKGDIGVRNIALHALSSIIKNQTLIVRTTTEIIEEYGDKYANRKGFLLGNGEIIINRDLFSADTPFHEYGHLVIRFLKATDPEAYQTIITKSLLHPTYSQIKKANPTLDDEALGEEIFITQVGLRTVVHLTRDASILGKIKKFFTKFLHKMFGVNLNSISLDDSLTTMIDKFSKDIVTIGNSFTNNLSDHQIQDIINSTHTVTDKDVIRFLYAEKFIRKSGNNELFYDTRGNISTFYLQAESKYGKEKAKEMYIAKMRRMVNVKNSVITPPIDMVKYVDEIHNEYKRNQNSYTNRVTNLTHGRATGFLTAGPHNKGGFKNEFDSTKAATVMAINYFRGKFEDDFYRMDDPERKGMTNVELEEAARDYVGVMITDVKNTTEFNTKIDEYIKIFNEQTITGTATHELADRFTLLRGALKEALDEGIVISFNPRNKRGMFRKKRGSHTRAGIAIKNSAGKEIVYNKISKLIEAYAEMNFDIKLPNGKIKRFNNAHGIPSSVRASRAKYYHQLHKHLTKFERGRNMIYRTEAIVGNEILDLAGTADIVAIEKGTNKLVIIDHKTKRVNHQSPNKNIKNWNNSFFPRLDGVFSGLANNKHNEASIQTSLYRLMYQAKGYDVEEDALVFFTEGEIYTPEEAAYGEYAELMDPEITTIKLRDTRQLIMDAYEELGIDITNLRATTNNDIHETMLEIFEGNDADAFEPSEYVVKSIAEASEVYYDHNNIEHYIFRYKTKRYNYPPGINESTPLAKKMEVVKKEINNKHRLLEEEEKIINYFNNPETITNEGEKRYLESRLGFVDNSTHEVIRVSKSGGFGDNYAGILLFKNKFSGEHSILILHAVNPENTIRLGNGERLITGGLISDVNAGRVIFTDKHSLLTANHKNMKQVKVAAVIAKYKNTDPDFNVEFIMNAPEIGSDVNVSLVSFEQLMITSREIFNYASQQNKLKPGVQTLIDSPGLFSAENYDASSLATLHKLLTNQSNGRPKGIYAKAIDSIEAYLEDPGYAVINITEALIQLRKSGKYNLNTEFIHSIDRAIMHVQGLQRASLDQDIEALEKFAVTPQNYSSIILQEMHAVTRNNKLAALNSITEDIRESASFTRDFLGFGNPANIGINSKFKNLFRPMDIDNPQDFYRFKDAKELTTEENIFVKKWKEKLIEAMSLNYEGKKDIIDNIKKYVDDGYIPLVFPGTTKSVIKAENRWETLMDTIHKGTRNGKDTKSDWEIKFKYAEEVRFANKSNQFSDARRRKLQIDTENIASKVPVFEMDLEVILAAVIVDAALVRHGNLTLAAGRAIVEEIHYKSLHSTMENKEIIDVINTLVRLGVKGQSKDSTAEKLASISSRLATTVAIAGSPPSIVIEGVTNTMNIAKAWVQESTMKRIFKMNNRFSATHLLSAATKITTDKAKVQAIMQDFGIMDPDPQQFAKFIQASKDWKMFKEENFYGLQATFLALAQAEIIIAIMIKDGSYDAYSVDNKGNLKYDIKKDKRFYNSLLTGKAKEKIELFRKKIPDLLKRENKFKDGNYTMGYTNIEIRSMKDYVVEAFSSMDADARNPATYAFFGKLQGKYRTWILPRVARMFGKKTYKNLSNFKWNYIYDKNGKLIDVIPQFGFAEGYFYTIGRLLHAVSDNMFLGKDMVKRTEFENQQLSKFMADSAIILGVLGLAAALKCSETTKKAGSCWYDTYWGSLLYRALLAAPGDIFVLVAIVQMTFGSSATMMPGLASVYSSIKHLLMAGSYAVHGDMEKAGKDAVQITAMSKAIYKAANNEKMRIMNQ